MHLKVLNRKQKNIISKLGFLKKRGFYLAGGTALALQLGHRTSKDLDFYNQKHFRSKNLLVKTEKELRIKAKEYSLAKETLFIRILDVDMSFFYYPYSLIKPLIKMNAINLASKEDIAAMKILSIVQRATKRDYVDIYFLLKELRLEDLLKFAKQKYPELNLYLALRALEFYKDIDLKEERRRGKIHIFSGVGWPAIKRFLTKEVKKYQLGLIKKQK